MMESMVVAREVIGGVWDDLDADAGLVALYDRYYTPMVRLAFLLTDSNAVAEDLVQDAFVALHRRLSSVDNPQAYLRTAVVNTARSYHRRRAVERRHLPLPTGPVLPAEPDGMWDLLAALPSRQRAALVLRFYEDLPEAEIAAVLGCRPATVRSLVHRGLARLRGVMADAEQ